MGEKISQATFLKTEEVPKAAEFQAKWRERGFEVLNMYQRAKLRRKRNDCRIDGGLLKRLNDF